MLQYILTENDRFSIAEQAQMAIEGGCKWIDLHLPDLDDTRVKEEIAPEVIDMCREAGIFLTIDDRPELARELGLHGVRMTVGASPAEAPMSPGALRDELGPEAVIGIETADPSAAPSMAAADIDFICTPAGFDSSARKSFIDSVRSLGIAMPIVAQGEITPENIRSILDEGFQGVAVGRYISRSDNPVEAVSQLLQAIEGK